MLTGESDIIYIGVVNDNTFICEKLMPVPMKREYVDTVGLSWPRYMTSPTHASSLYGRRKRINAVQGDFKQV